MSDGVSHRATRGPVLIGPSRSEAAWVDYKSIKDASTLRKIAVYLMKQEEREEIGSSDINCKCVDLIMSRQVIVKDGQALYNDDMIETLALGIYNW